MKKGIASAMFATVLAVLAGCGEKDTRSVDELLAIINEAANYVPLLVEAGTGERLLTTKVNDLKDGRDLFGVRQIKYFDDTINVTWSGLEGDNYAEFSQSEFDATTMQIRPDYPVYDLVLDGQGNDITPNKPDTISGQLRATLSIRDVSVVVKYNVWLRPQIKINWKDLFEVRDSGVDEIVGVRGYITSIYPDYDALTIQSGHYAMTLYKVQAYINAGFKVGDFIEAAGAWRPFNGLNEIGYIKRMNKVDPAEYGGVAPTVHSITTAHFKEWYDAGSDSAAQLMTHLYDLDSARVKIDEPMTILRAEDRDRNEIALDMLPVGKTHANVILGAKVDGVDIEIKLSLSYHIGEAAQQAIKDKIVTAGKGAQVKFDGILSWYNEPVLGPNTVNNIIFL